MNDPAYNQEAISITDSVRFGDSPYFVFCDHASNAMPAAFDCLGLPQDILATHIAWDLGAGALAEALGNMLGGEVFKCGFSRLIIDPNRDLTSRDLIPAVADQIPVPGNQMLNAEDRRNRIERFHEPYHQKLGGAIETFAARNADPLFISIHSFTDRLMGASEERPWPIGMLWREDETSAKQVISFLRDKTGWQIGDNEPYDARVFNYSIDRHIGPRGFRHLTFEVRQDYLADKAGQIQMCALIAGAIQTLRNHA